MKPAFTSEADLDRRYKTKSFLASGGDYGCGAVVFEGDLVDDSAGVTKLFTDEWFYDLNEQHPNDVGTILVTGDVRVAGDIYVSDRLMCLVVLGTVKAKSLHVFETEVWIGGALDVATLVDRDHYVTVASRAR